MIAGKSVRPSSCHRSTLVSALGLRHTGRSISSNSIDHASSKSPTALDPKWLSDVKARVGKCIFFGLSTTDQFDQARKILHQVACDWRELVAGSEGYLTSKGRRGLHRQEVVWGEMDSMGHVNNVQYVRYAESGRCNWMRNYAMSIDPKNKDRWLSMASSKGTGLILRSIKMDYKFPMTWPDHISVYHKFRSLPTETTDSIILDVLILSEARQRPAARALEDVVIYDYRKGKKTTLEPFMLEQFQKTFALQEEAKEKNNRRIHQILEDVRTLEKSSWDRPDAKEDLGSAK